MSVTNGALQAAIKSAAKLGKRQRLTDGEIKGLRWNVSAAGNVSAEMRVKHNGQRHGETWRWPEHSIGEVRKLARAFASDTVAGAIQCRATVDQAVAWCWAEVWHDAKPSTRRKYESEVKRLVLGKWRGRPLDSINAGEIIEHRNTLNRGNRSVGDRMVLRMRSIYQAARNHYPDLDDPTVKIRVKPSGRREHFATADDFAAIARILDTHGGQKGWHPSACDQVRVACLTGLRYDELFRLEDAWLDLERGLIHFPDTKTGPQMGAEARRILPEAAAILRRVIERKQAAGIDSPYTFASHRKRAGHRIHLERIWGKVRAKLGERGRVLTVHCLRHGFVTLMLAMGVPLPHVMRLVGHENMATTQKYLHLAGLDAGWQGYTAGPLGQAMGVTVEPPAGSPLPVAVGALTIGVQPAAAVEPTAVGTELAAAA